MLGRCLWLFTRLTTHPILDGTVNFVSVKLCRAQSEYMELSAELLSATVDRKHSQLPSRGLLLNSLKKLCDGSSFSLARGVDLTL